MSILATLVCNGSSNIHTPYRGEMLSLQPLVWKRSVGTDREIRASFKSDALQVTGRDVSPSRPRTPRRRRPLDFTQGYGGQGRGGSTEMCNLFPQYAEARRAETNAEPEHRRHDRQTAPHLPHSPAMDGLRAAAVIAVLLYHAGLPWIPGGFLGVEVFFVISGYLITSLLLAEWTNCGHIDLKDFWMRRARRLFPALFVLLLSVIAYAVVFLPCEVAGLRGDVLSTAVYMNNWYQIFAYKSYFEAVGRPSLLRHMWSLAVEEQFYLLWPILFSVLMSCLRPRRALFAILAGVAASSTLMATLYQPDADPSRSYYGTDTRAAGLLLGAALAFVRMPLRSDSRAGIVTLNAAGIAAIGGLTLCFLRINESQAFLYQGGFILVGLMTAVLIVASVHPRANLAGRLLSCGPLRWVGVRSYGIYLWHFPVFMATRPQLDVAMDGWPLLIARLALTVLIAALSYRFVEMPIRKGALGRAWAVMRNANGRSGGILRLRWAAALLSVTAVVAALGASLANARAPRPPEYLSAAPAPDEMAKPADPEEAPVTEAVLAPVVSTAPSAAVAPAVGTVPAESIAVIGDSVILGVSSELKRALGDGITIDAEQGRRARSVLSAVRNLRAAGRTMQVVVLQIGNNGFISADMFERIMTELQDARLVCVLNVRVPRSWENPNNAMIASSVRRYPNAILLDWRRAGDSHPEMFWKDGIHLRPAGARFCADFIAQAVQPRRPGEPESIPLAASAGAGFASATTGVRPALPSTHMPRN